MAAQPNGSGGDPFDAVIVGAGAAGSVLASRLTEDAGVTVGMLECDPPDRPARMGPATDPTAVVDDALRVHGMQGCGWWMPRSCPICPRPTPMHPL